MCLGEPLRSRVWSPGARQVEGLHSEVARAGRCAPSREQAIPSTDSTPEPVRAASEKVVRIVKTFERIVAFALLVLLVIVVSLALVALAQKVIILNPGANPTSQFGLAALILALAGSFWFVRSSRRRHALPDQPSS
jgi:hypothetical protein